MLTARIKIGDGQIVDTQTYGLVYLDSDKVVGAPTKGFESTQYPEEEGEHAIPKTVDAAFDYKAKFFFRADSLETANDKIDAFNKLLYDQAAGSDTKVFKQVTFFNDHKRHKIVGYPQPIAEATEFWRDPASQVNDVVVAELNIRVTKPSLCEWSTPFTEDQTPAESD